MTVSRYYIIAFFLSLGMIGLSSCVKEIDLEYLRPASRLVLNSIAEVGKELDVSVSRTWFLTENNPNVTIPNAEVDLYVNGIFRERMAWRKADGEDIVQKGCYHSSYCPATGETLKIVARAPGYKEVSAETLLPAPTPILDLKIEPYYHSEYGSRYKGAMFKLTFQDNPNQEDYYLLRYEQGIPLENPVGDEKYEWSSYSVDFSKDPVFTNQHTVMDQIMGYDWIYGYRGRYFSDELFNGKEYTIKVTTSYYPTENYPIRARLYTLSKSYFLYLRSMMNATDGNFVSDLANAGLAEPIKIYSNVLDGVGILGGCQLEQYVLQINQDPNGNNEGDYTDPY